MAVAFRWLYSLLTGACLLLEPPCNFFLPGSSPSADSITISIFNCSWLLLYVWHLIKLTTAFDATNILKWLKTAVGVWVGVGDLVVCMWSEKLHIKCRQQPTGCQRLLPQLMQFPVAPNLRLCHRLLCAIIQAETDVATSKAAGSRISTKWKLLYALEFRFSAGLKDSPATTPLDGYSP